MTLISIFDLVDNDSYFRTELREEIEEVYPGIFDFSKNYFIKIKDWNNSEKDYEILTQILISLRYNKPPLYIYRSRFNDKLSGILTRYDEILIYGICSLNNEGSFRNYFKRFGGERNISVDCIDEYCEDTKYDWIEIDVDEFISKIMEFANTLYIITRRKVVFGLD